MYVRLLVTLFIAGMGLGFAAAEEEEAVEVFRNASGYVVAIESVASNGTGILLDDSGLVLTNAHVVAIPLPLHCTATASKDGRDETVIFHKVKLLGVHPTADLALVKLDPREHDVRLQGAKILTEKAVTGQRVYAIGNPNNSGVELSKTITSGLLSGVDRVIDGESYYQFSAPINPGNSGGPLCDREGQVLGVVTLKSAEADNVAFAIPLYDFDADQFRPIQERPSDPVRSGELITQANKFASEFAQLERLNRHQTLRGELLKMLSLQFYEEALLLNPANYTIYVAIATLLEKFGELEAAEAYHWQALQLAPWGKDSRVYRSFGMNQVLQKKQREAIILWEEGVAKHPILGTQIWEDLAIVYRDAEDYQKCAYCAGMLLALGQGSSRGNFPHKLLELCFSKAASEEQRNAIEQQVKSAPLGLNEMIRHRIVSLGRKRAAMTNAFATYVNDSGYELQVTELDDNSPVGIQFDAADYINVLAKLDEGAMQAGWQLTDGTLHSPTTAKTRLPLRDELPEQYDLFVEVERKSGSGELAIGFARGGRSSLFLVDYVGSKSGLAGSREGLYEAAVLPTGERVELILRVRQEGLRVTAGDKRVFLRMNEELFPAVPKAYEVAETTKLFLASSSSEFVIHGIDLISIPKPPIRQATAPDKPLASIPAAPSVPARAKPAISVASPDSTMVQADVRIGDLGWGVVSLEFSPDNGYLAVGKMDDAVLLYDTKQFQRSEDKQDLELLGQVTTLCFSPDGKRLLTGGYRGLIQAWDVAPTGKLTPQKQFAGHSSEVKCIAISPDGRHALSGDRDGRLRYWEVDTMREQRAFTGLERDALLASITSDGKSAIGFDGKTLLRVDLESGETKSSVEMRRNRARVAAMSRDGSTIACADGRGLEVWDIASTRQIAQIEADELIWGITFGPDPKTVFVGKRGCVEMWDVEHRKSVKQFQVGELYVKALTVSPNGRLLAAIPSAAGQEIHLFTLTAAEK